ncbi:hypothetical protein BJX63DRAFT_162889 [Aspergillus granulosus]|uniref:Uncharacterized protein n=1 Tax=Aspergillus granulosus TaxID=176169 RepID=A0ABR4GS01_9EURO
MSPPEKHGGGYVPSINDPARLFYFPNDRNPSLPSTTAAGDRSQTPATSDLSSNPFRLGDRVLSFPHPSPGIFPKSNFQSTLLGSNHALHQHSFPHRGGPPPTSAADIQQSQYVTSSGFSLSTLAARGLSGDQSTVLSSQPSKPGTCLTGASTPGEQPEDMSIESFQWNTSEANISTHSYLLE